MKVFWWVALIMVSGFLLVGCQEGNTILLNGPASQKVVGFDFVNFVSGCSLSLDIDLDDGLNCSNGTRPSFTYFDSNLSTWNGLCCSFKSDKCSNQSTALVDDICGSSYNSSINVYTFLQGASWNAMCCDINGNGCVIDNSVDINDNSSICDLDFNLLTESLTFNLTSVGNWDGVCCLGGAE